MLNNQNVQIPKSISVQGTSSGQESKKNQRGLLLKTTLPNLRRKHEKKKKSPFHCVAAKKKKKNTINLVVTLQGSGMSELNQVKFQPQNLHL